MWALGGSVRVVRVENRSVCGDVLVDHRGDVEPGLGDGADRVAVEVRGAVDGVDGLIPGGHEVAGDAIFDEFVHGPSGVGDDGGPAGHGFDDAVAEWFVEIDEVKECVGTT